MSTADPDQTQYVGEKSRRLMAFAALRKLRVQVDALNNDEAAIRRFTIRSLLWLAIAVLAFPLLSFVWGALRTLLEYQAKGLPLSEFLARLQGELIFPAVLLTLLATAALYLRRHYRQSRDTGR